MPEPPTSQPFLGTLTSSAIFLVLTVDPGGERRPGAARRPGRPGAVGRLPAARGQLTCAPASARRPGTGCSAVRVRPGCTRSVSSTAAEHHAPATPGDLLFHIRAARMDLCFELAAQIMSRLAGSVTVVRRGARVPLLRRAGPARLRRRHREPDRPAPPQAAVLIGDEDPDFAGGSYVIVQKYLHDLVAWNAAAGRGAGEGDRPHASCPTSRCPMTSSRPTRTSR